MDPFLILGALLIIVGLAMAFIGRKLWNPFMSLVGAILGGTVGYTIGVYVAPTEYLAPLLLALLGSVLGSMLFNYLVKIALAIIAALVPTSLVYFAMPAGDVAARDLRMYVAIGVLLVFFAIAYYFVEELIGIVTSLVGGFLLGAGVVLVTLPTPQWTWALAAGGILFLVGAIMQTLAIRAAKRGGAFLMRRARVARVVAPAPVVVPPPQPVVVQPPQPVSPPQPAPPYPPPPPPPPPET